MNKKRFVEKIPDIGMQSYIVNGFDMDADPFDLASHYYSFIDNLVNLAFMYVLSCYQDVANRNYSQDGEGPLDVCMKCGSSNSVRVLNNMKRIYNGYPITNELIQYILLDIYFDYELGDYEAGLKEIFPDFINTHTGLRLDQVFSVINKTHSSERNKNAATWEVVRPLLSKLVDMFPFLQKTKLEFDRERRWYVFRLDATGDYRYYPAHTVNTFGMILKIDADGLGYDGDYYFLSAIKDDATLQYTMVGKDEFVLCPLIGMDGDDNGFSTGVLGAPFSIPRDEEFFCSMLAPDKLESIKKPAISEYAIEQLFHIKYKYIKNLALAIADALGLFSGSDVASMFRKEFEQKFPQVFKHYDEALNNWDTVVLMLLIETSPSFVLQKLFYMSKSIAARIINNLRKRFGDEFSANLCKHLYGDAHKTIGFDPGADLLRRAQQLVHIRAVNKNVKAYNELHANYVAEKMADIILSAIVFKDDDDSVHFCIGNTRPNIEALEELRDETDMAEKCQGIYTAFGELLIKLTCFYDGLLAYGAKKNEYDELSGAKMLSTEQINRFQAEAETAFSERAKKRHEKFMEICDGHSLLPIIHEFKEVCESCYELKGNRYERKDESRHLHCTLGKSTVLDNRLFGEMIKDLPKEDLNNGNADRWIDQALAFIRFFRNGATRSKSNEISQFTTIIPFIASYNEEKHNKDGYHTAMFSLVFSAGDSSHRQQEVNVLSEFHYNMNSKYYCLPNLVTSTEKWWIDPFIIKCQAFDDIFEER